MVDPLEVFISTLYDIVKHDYQEKGKARGQGWSMLARRSDSLRRQGTINLTRTCSGDSISSAVSETPHERRVSQRLSGVNAIEAVLYPHGRSAPATVGNSLKPLDALKELTGSEMALIDAKDVNNALKHSRARGDVMHDVKLHGPVDVSDAEFEKLTIIPSDLYEFVSSQYDFHIRLQTELFN